MLKTPSRICECHENSRSACGGQQITTSERGETKHYCILHFPSANKAEAFEQAIRDKLEQGDFNFNGVWFPRELNFSGGLFDGEADFRNAIFHGKVNCHRATFAKKAQFRNATFNEEANFAWVNFQGEVNFSDVQFKTEALFTRAEFDSEAELSNTRSHWARFDFAIFEKKVTFNNSIFEKADLSHIVFKGDAEFSRTTFATDLPLSDSKFLKCANFSSARFKGNVNLLSSSFAGPSDFSEAVFGAKVKFTKLPIKGVATFSKTVFEGKVDFSGAIFNGAKFKHTVFCNKADFQGAIFNTCSSKYYVEQADFSRVEFRGEADFAQVSFKTRILTGEEEKAAEDLAQSSSGTYQGLTEKERVVTADFGRTRFYGEADFASSTFEINADFSRAIFSDYADFSPHESKGKPKQTIFLNGVGFEETTFNGVANFSQVDFQSSEVTFTHATFKDYVRFSGEDRKKLLAKSLNLRLAMIDKPERMSFHSVGLHPCWFVDVDLRKFDFTNVKWHVKRFKDMFDRFEWKRDDESFRLLEKLCQQLAFNHEEHQRYRWASRWRYWAMEARRRERFYGLPIWRLHWWYWLASGYSERSLRAFLGLGLIWLSFAFFYMTVDFQTPQLRPDEAAATKLNEQLVPGTVNKSHNADVRTLEPKSALIYSLGVMTLQKPEPRPKSTWAGTLVAIETIMGPLQAALFALAVRRKFMR
jgi:uncharacterized protein YjbI with pentapeptide repeats